MSDLKLHIIETIDGEELVHYPGASGADYTLCGLTLDGDPAVVKTTRTIVWSDPTGDLWHCEACRAIIHHCVRMHRSE